ncbi:DNA ligase D [Methylocapsa acidiphila]|uniref:DNA ligase D n=1 Tax=Methylocapsa acidiphila TaxID=133552 RepID=UPI0004275953|nr:DNA ligase D [Methylocapsa acidiphila]
MALQIYRNKRDFQATSEPRGKSASARGGHLFVIQKHAARRLHYDLRLEFDGVLKSWAVARGPSLVAGEKRLAVHVEDHPLEYADFEGVIPKGEYGGGTVIVWDRGEWAPVGDWREAYAKGHLEFELRGEKLNGRWLLVRMANRRGEKRPNKENWLLIKRGDDAARSENASDILQEEPDSVKSGRGLEEVAAAGVEPKPSRRKATRADREIPRASAAPDPSTLEKAAKAPLPAFIEPALAVLCAKPPGGARWIHEIKYDGCRLQARINGGRLALLTRGELDWTAKFGEMLARAFKALPLVTGLIDGELVVENANGASDFSALQAELSQRRASRFVFYAFDLLYLDGYDLRTSPLIERKAALEQLLASAPEPLRYSVHFDDDGDLILQHACRLSLEGVVSKLRDGRYRSGRTAGWRKSKCFERQEFVIGGYVPSSTSRKAVGSLVLGYYEKDQLIPVGRVGTGFTAAAAEDLHGRLEPMRVDAAPFAQPLVAEAARGVRYVRPALVAEVEFRGWTADNNLRHASFRGLREDKPAREVMREDSSKNVRAAPRHSITLTHPERLYWPEAGVTKEGLADYYSEVWPRMAFFVVGRPLAVVRCPDGVEGQCFFQKHAWRGLARSVRSFPDPKNAAEEPLLVIDDLDGLIGLVQGGALEIHPWGATVAALERPDMIVMDLDPGPDVSWLAVVSASVEVRQRLKEAGLDSFVKSSGGKGLHVVAPLLPKFGWTAVKAFAKSIAEAMSSDSRDLYVSTISKAKRRGKIFVDYLRNGRGATSVAPYSTRARRGASVSMPLAWDELSEVLGPAYFNVSNAPGRLANLRADPWRGFREAAVPLPAPARRAAG